MRKINKISRRTTKLAIIIASGISFICSNGLQAQNLVLDPSFNGTGKLILSISANQNADHGNAMALQTDGKIIIVGDAHNGANYDFAILRLNVNGTPDTSFNLTGQKMIPIGSATIDSAKAVAIQTDGKILIGGESALARLNPNGTLDPTFAIGGILAIQLKISGIALQSDGKILASGSCSSFPNPDFCVSRFNADGTLDISFNATGNVKEPIGIGDDVPTAIKIQPDGKIIVSGFCVSGAMNTINEFCALRLNTNGTLDTGFNGTGKLKQAIAGYDTANAIALQSNGKIIIAGTCATTNLTVSDFCALRLNTNGSLDTSFNLSGMGTYQVGLTTDNGAAVVLQPNGKIIISGGCHLNVGSYCATRLMQNGVVDTSFGTNGKFLMEISTGQFSGQTSTSAILQPNGRLVLGGFCNSNGMWGDFCALRLMQVRNTGPFFDTSNPAKKD